MNTSLEKLISAFLAFREHFNQQEKKNILLCGTLQERLQISFIMSYQENN